MAKKRSKKKSSARRATSKAAKKRTAKKSKRAGKRTGARLTAYDTETLEQELKRRNRDVAKLEAKRDKLAQDLAELEAEIIRLGGGSKRVGVKRRPRNEMNLADALVKTLKNKTMSVSEVAEAVQESGYRTTSENFTTIVNQTLLRDKRFKKISRGRYTSK